MFCPTCQTVVFDGPGFCPTCGDTMREVAPADEIEVVEVTAELLPDAPPDASPAHTPRDPVASTSTALAVRRTDETLSPALVRAGRFALAAWRQPAVRAAVKTGASAVALSVALRVARQALTVPSARRLATRTVLPSLPDLFHAENEPPNGKYEVVETFFYMRRVVRR